jgi:hypothetical protein
MNSKLRRKVFNWADQGENAKRKHLNPGKSNWGEMISFLGQIKME